MAHSGRISRSLKKKQQKSIALTLSAFEVSTLQASEPLPCIETKSTGSLREYVNAREGRSHYTVTFQLLAASNIMLLIKSRLWLITISLSMNCSIVVIGWHDCYQFSMVHML